MKVKVTTRKRKRSTAVMLDYRSNDGTRIQRVVGSATSARALTTIKEQAARDAARIEHELAENKHRPRKT